MAWPFEEGDVRKRWLIRGGLLAAALLLGLVVYHVTGGLDVAVVNEGQSPMRALVVQVTGKSYPLGDIPAGSTRTIRVEPAGKSGVEMEFHDAEDRLIRLSAGGSFEPGYRGTVTVHVKDGAVVKVEGLPASGGR
jgi:hypothetical protein